MRRERVDAFSRRVGGYGRIGRGVGGHGRSVTDIRAHEYARVVPDASGFGDA